MKSMKQAIAILLCFLMLFTSPVNAFATSVDESGIAPISDTTEDYPQYNADIEKLATFNAADTFADFRKCDSEPFSLSDSSYAYKSDFSSDVVFEIIGYKVLTEILGEVEGSVATVSLWYSVKIHSGTAPEDLRDGFWIYQNDLSTDTYQNVLTLFSPSEEDPEQPACAICGGENCTAAHLYCSVCKKFDCGQKHTYENPYKPDTTPVIPENPELTEGAAVSVVDAEGKAVTQTGIWLNEGEKTSLSAWSDLEDGENVTYQWQICYDTENDLWADVKGQTGKGILVSPAVVNSIIQLRGSATIRCRITSGETVQYSAGIPVEVVGSASSSSEGYHREQAVGNAVPYAETPALGEYTIVINYVFEDGEPVAQSYTASLAAGSSFSATVPHPNVMGYLPYVNEAAETSTKIDLNITNIQADITYTVTYKPTNVKYTVIHYQQNIDNDNYTIFATEEKSGVTKTTVPDVAKSYTGFYALLYERPEIAADGSTVVEIYYDRNYYLMIFNLGEGGYGVEPIYARYGAPVEIGTPTRPGYTFNGWSPKVPSTVPSDGGLYTAQWTANDTAKVKVVFWGENPNDEGYSYLTTGVIDAKPGTEYTFADGSSVFLICGKDEHNHTKECLSCGKVEHTEHTNACIDCDELYHAHNVTCYEGDGAKHQWSYDEHYVKGTETNGSIGESYTNFFGEHATGNKYIYIDGSWYRYTGTASVGDTVSPSCGIAENLHEHSADCYTCEYHEHTAACYSCGKEVHTHNSSCNQTGSGLDSNLWKFVRSETVTVAADGSTVVNVYYDRTTFTMTFKKEGYNGATLDTITDKWGADIKTRFETISKANTFFWSMKSNGGSPWTSFMDIMPQENRTYYADPQGGSTTITATYFAQKLDGTGYETLYTVSFKGSGVTVTKEEFVDIEGFDFNDSLSTDIGSSYNGAKFYYDRHKYAIEFYSPTALLRKTENVAYGSELTSHKWTPDASMAPDQYEPGSVEFEGWYLNPECTGDKFVFTTHTMPAGTKDGDTTLTLYAKWTPVTRTVEFYLNKTDMENGNKLYRDQTTPHGSLLGNPVADPTNGAYTFVGWFYMDGDEEKAFLFSTMVITKDMKVYGKWSSNVLKEYSVYFKIQGTDTQIADPITGSGLAGTTETFDAKGGTELYEQYQEGCFPLVKSHSMTLDIENDANNTYTFWYVEKRAVPYTVYYVTESQNEEGNLTEVELDGKIYYLVGETKTVSDNRQAVVTEKFVPVSGYMPDAYQKRLIVDGTDGVENKIIFIYSEDTVHAYYKITHYTQNLDGETWTEHAFSQAIGEIGGTYTAEPLTIDGFTYDPAVAGTVGSGVLTADGLELKLYYVRNQYPYEVRYHEQGTGKQLADPKTGTGKYGQVISENAIVIAGYTAVEPTVQELVIRIEENGTEAKLNVITFYYQENEAQISYIVVGPEGCGTVSLSGETVKVLTGKAQGSTAAANKNYRFVAWYSDEACTKKIGDNAVYVPTKPENGWKNVTYYAKFELAVMDLTIEKTGCQNIDENQSFIFDVTGPNGFKLAVTVNGNGSVTIKDLPIGTYTVTERTDWSWRYVPNEKEQTIALAPDGSNKVTFNNSRTDIYWLSGDCWAENQFTVKSKEEEE